MGNRVLVVLAMLVIVLGIASQAKAVRLYVDNDEEIVVLSGDGVRTVAEREVRFYKGLNDGYEYVRSLGRPLRASDFKLYYDKKVQRYEIHLGGELVLLVTSYDAQDHKAKLNDLAIQWFSTIRDSYLKNQPPLSSF